MKDNIEGKKLNQGEPSVWRLLIFVLTVLITFSLLTFQISIRKTSYSLSVGDVATQDILAPRTLTFESQILTEQARNDAENMVDRIYLPADPTISRNQVQYLRLSFQFITTVRGDTYASETQKISDISKLVFVRLDEATIKQVLDLTDDDWKLVQSESQRILETVMQNSIRDDQVSAQIENIPTMISYSINPKISSLIDSLTRRFVVPNSLYSSDLTEKSRGESRESVQPRERTFITNQTIVSRGQIITELIFEALDKMGLVSSKNDNKKILSTGLLVLGLAIFALFFFLIDERHQYLNLRECIMIAVLYLSILFAARIFIPNRAILPFLFPIQSLGLTIACLSGRSYGIVMSIIIGFLVPYDFADGLNYSTFYIISSLTGILVLQNARQILNFLLAGLASGFVGIPIILAYQIIGSSTDMVGLVTLAAASVISGLLSAGLTLIFQYSFARFIGVATSLELLELIRPDSPLLQFILNTAPGTYQHSLMVANLSEQAAKVIGADPLLVRAGAMYHDAGKALNPSYFVENQVSGELNLHEDITPKESASFIIQHVPDGEALIKKYHLPEVILNFVREHHGNNITRYQYTQAVNNDGEENVDIADFTYPGSRPKSKETALVMLADTCEARARAEKPKNDEEINTLVKNTFNYYSTSGQLDDAPLTLRDLTKIRESFVNVLRNSYHPRVKYPEANKHGRRTPVPAAQPTTPAKETAAPADEAQNIFVPSDSAKN